MPSNESHQLVAVLVNWNGGDRVRSCLRMLQAVEGRRPDHIVLVDNASTDGVAEELRAGGVVTVIANSENRGFARACNQGIACARDLGAEFIFLMNDDAAFRGDVLGELLASAERHPGGGAFGGRILNGSGDRIWCAGVHIGPYPNLQKLIGFGELNGSQLSEEREVPALTGCGLLLRGSVLNDVGMFDERFFVYVEDIDLCIRMKSAGHEVWYTPSAVMTHDASQSTGGGYSRWRKYLLAYNVALLVKKNRRVSLWLWFVIMEVLLWPPLLLSSLVTGRFLGALSKGRGTFSALVGLPVRRPAS